MPIYDATDPESTSSRFCSDGVPGLLSASSNDCYLLPVDVGGQEDVCLGLSEGVLTGLPHEGSYSAESRARMHPGIPHISLRRSLVILDLSRAHLVTSLSASSLGNLRTTWLPPSVHVVCLDNCVALAELRPTNGCPQLISLQLEGCRQLSGASFCNLSDGTTLWSLSNLHELNLCWCTRFDAQALTSLLPQTTSLRSLSMRGLRLSGVLEAVLQPPFLSSLTALDLGFTSAIHSHAVHVFARSRPGLLRCNLRAAAEISATVYNDVGQLMLARAANATASSSGDTVSRPDEIENRRRPKHLAARHALPYFYLKRARRECAA